MLCISSIILMYLSSTSWNVFGTRRDLCFFEVRALIGCCSGMPHVSLLSPIRFLARFEMCSSSMSSFIVAIESLKRFFSLWAWVVMFRSHVGTDSGDGDGEGARRRFSGLGVDFGVGLGAGLGVDLRVDLRLDFGVGIAFFFGASLDVALGTALA